MIRAITFSTLSFVVLVAFSITPAQEKPQPTPVAIKIEPATFDPYVGQYEDRTNLAGLVFSFFREGNKFYARVTNQDKVEITPAASDKFFSATPRFDVTFHRDANGKITGATFTEGLTYELARTADVPQPDTHVGYTRSELMIPMRDGAKLHTIVLVPEHQTEKLPIYMDRTPYGVDAWTSSRLNQSRAELAQ